MPEITVVHIGLLTLAVVAGVIAGWVMRGNRCTQEKTAVNVGWQEQLEAQRTEHSRLLGQNKSLMDQVSQYQASGKDATNRAKELSGALKETFERRDELQREIKEVRSMLESAVGERDELQANMESRSEADSSSGAALQRKDDKLFKLTRELENWQNRLPPLIERFRVRNEEAEQLESDLADAQERIQTLESMSGSEQTRAEQLNHESLSHRLDASNDTGDENTDVESDDLVAADEILEEDDVEDIVDVDDETHIEEHSFDAEDLDHDKAHNESDSTTLRDDLKKIKGIGPAIEKTLNELGIVRLGQIAEMNEYDIDRVAKRLKGFRTRIYREDWIGQARELQDQQAGGQA